MPTASPLLRFLLLYGGMFSAFGVAAPFLPGLLKQDGLTVGLLGVVLSGGALVRLVAGPLGGRLADAVRRPSAVLAGFAAASALVATLYAPARGAVLLLGVSVLHAAVLAPLTPVADALALGSAEGERGFPYGWVRGGGSAAFIVGTLVSGQLVGRWGLGVIVWLNAGLLGVAALCAAAVPNRKAGAASASPAGDGWAAWRALFRVPVFAPLMATVALIGGSHTLHDTFEVIRWRSAGRSTPEVSLLWSVSVAAEMLVFFYAGPRLLRWLGPGRAVMLAGGAGVVRWSAAALTASFPVMAAAESLHGLTFALLHLACMEVIGAAVPVALAATAQAFYATVAMGGTTAMLTFASGALYGGAGASAFWAMAAMCVAALPLAWMIWQRERSAGRKAVLS